MESLCFSKLKTVLCLGAHSDDIEIGCGGTLLRLIEANPKLQVEWVVFGAGGTRRNEALASAKDFLKSAADKSVHVHNFKDGFFPEHWAAIKTRFEQIKGRFRPDLVFTHYREDRHQDHRVLSDLAWNTFRKHLILEYEIPKFDGDLAQPNFFVPLDRTICEQKTKTILKHFASQSKKQWFDEETIFALLRLRGVECASPTKYAEAFHCRKICWGM